jgi:hypothetical protein
LLCQGAAITFFQSAAQGKARIACERRTPPQALNLTHKIEQFTVAKQGVAFLQALPNTASIIFPPAIRFIAAV